MKQALAGTFVHSIPVIAITLIAVLNAATVGLIPAPPQFLKTTASVTGLAQDWNVFAPEPSLLDGYVRMEATLADGSVRNIRPAIASRDQRWTRLVFNLVKDNAYPLGLPALAAYACREWDRAHAAERIADLSIEMVLLDIQKPDQAPEPEQARVEVLWSGACPS